MLISSSSLEDGHAPTCWDLLYVLLAAGSDVQFLERDHATPVRVGLAVLGHGLSTAWEPKQSKPYNVLLPLPLFVDVHM